LRWRQGVALEAVALVATSYLLGVSTRRMDKLVETLGITSLSKSEVSVTAKELDTAVEAFRSCPLDASPGSGKSMAYIVPIIDRVAWEGSGHGVRPVVAYPMNAPANSQCNNLEKFLVKANRKVTFERWFTFQNK
jgi:superfamily II DNA/RNA helicase